MKKLPGVKDAQITLLDFAQTEVVKFMRTNARTVRLSGTVFSRTLEMQQDLASFIDENPQATEIPLTWVSEFVDKLVGATRGTFATSIDTQTVLRLAVSHRLEKALKVDHLSTTNPLRAEREDFIPPTAMRRIEDAAKRTLESLELVGRHPARLDDDGLVGCGRVAALQYVVFGLQRSARAIVKKAQLVLFCLRHSARAIDKKAQLVWFREGLLIS
jgi:hypothetical protein